MDKNILDRIYCLLKTKVNMNIFDLQSIDGWSAEIDRQFNSLIDSRQICCVEKHDISVRPNLYRINTGVDCVLHKYDDATRKALIDLLEESKKYESVNGYTEYVKAYLEKFQRELHSAIDNRLAFINENQSLMWAILENSMEMLHLNMDLLVGRTIIKVQLPDEHLINKLLSVQSNLFKKVFG